MKTKVLIVGVENIQVNWAAVNESLYIDGAQISKRDCDARELPSGGECFN